MSVEVGKTYTMRMGYGEEIVAKVTAFDSSTYTLSKLWQWYLDSKVYN